MVEVTELVNCPDVVELGIYIQGESVNLDNVRVEEFQRKLNLYTGELRINILFRTQNGLRFLPGQNVLQQILTKPCFTIRQK